MRDDLVRAVSTGDGHVKVYTRSSFEEILRREAAERAERAKRVRSNLVKTHKARIRQLGVDPAEIPLDFDSWIVDLFDQVPDDMAFGGGIVWAVDPLGQVDLDGGTTLVGWTPDSLIVSIVEDRAFNYYTTYPRNPEVPE